MRFVKENGLETEKEYPYSAVKHDQCSLKQNDTRVFIDDYRMLSQNEEDVADWVATKGPVTFGIYSIVSLKKYLNEFRNASDQSDVQLPFRYLQSFR